MAESVEKITQRRGRPRRWEPGTVLDSIRRNKGILSQVARELNTSRSAIHDYLARHRHLLEEVAAAREELVDIAEWKLTEAIERGEIVAILFCLKTLGRHRGWAERYEVTGPGGADVQVTFVEAAAGGRKRRVD